jgi:hypothetical protein
MKLGLWRLLMGKKVLDPERWSALVGKEYAVVEFDLELNRSYSFYSESGEKIKAKCIGWWSSGNGRTCKIKVLKTKTESEVVDGRYNIS